MQRDDDGEFNERQEAIPTVVVCSGDLVEQACLRSAPFCTTLTVFR